MTIQFKTMVYRRKILDALKENPGLTTRDLAEDCLQCKKSTAHQIIKSMEAEGLLKTLTPGSNTHHWAPVYRN